MIDEAMQASKCEVVCGRSLIKKSIVASGINGGGDQHSREVGFSPTVAKSRARYSHALTCFPRQLTIAAFLHSSSKLRLVQPHKDGAPISGLFSPAGGQESEGPSVRSPSSMMNHGRAARQPDGDAWWTNMSRTGLPQRKHPRT